MSASKRKGTRGENLVVEYLRNNGFPLAERRALGGTNDRGDVTGIGPLIIEVKNVQKVDLSGWMDEVEVERLNANADFGFAVALRRLKPAPAAYAIMDLESLVMLLRDAGYGEPR